MGDLKSSWVGEYVIWGEWHAPRGLRSSANFPHTLPYPSFPSDCSWVMLMLFSCSAMSDSLQPNGLQHSRLPCPSLFPGVCSNSCPLSQWCHPTILSSIISLSSCLQSFPASGSFPMNQFFSWGSQSIGVSASTSVLPMNIQDWFPSGFTCWVSLQSKGLSRVFLQHHSSKTSILQCSAFFTIPLSHLYMTTVKTIALTRWIFVSKVMSLLFIICCLAWS